MLGFGRARNNDSSTEQSDEHDVEEVHVVYQKELEFDYTEHDGVAHFDNGETAEFTFDKMDEVNGAYVLSDYTGTIGEKERPMIGTVKHTPSRKFVSIPKSNLNYFETTERRERTLTDSVRHRIEVAGAEESMATRMHTSGETATNRKS